MYFHHLYGTSDHMGRAASVSFSSTPISMRFPITRVYAEDGPIKAAELLSTSSHKDKVKGVQGGLRHGHKLRELGGERKEYLVPSTPLYECLYAITVITT